MVEVRGAEIPPIVAVVVDNQLTLDLVNGISAYNSGFGNIVICGIEVEIAGQREAATLLDPSPTFAYPERAERLVRVAPRVTATVDGTGASRIWLR